MIFLEVVLPQSQYDTLKPVVLISKTMPLKLPYPEAHTYMTLRTWLYYISALGFNMAVMKDVNMT